MIFRVYFRRKSADSEQNVLLVKGKQELERILSRKTPIAVAWEKAKLHRCNGCNRRGPWEKGWAWAGGWAAGELNVVSISCSQPCRDKVPRPERGWTGAYEPLPAGERAKRQTVGMSEYDRAALTRERRSVPLPECPTDGKRRCRWCCGEITGPYAHLRSWHPECKRIWLLHYDANCQARFLAERDGFDCWDCRRGGRWHRIDLVLAIYRWERWPLCMPAPKIDWNDRYPVDLGERKVDGVIVGLYTAIEWRPHCGPLEVDHEIPLWKIWDLPDDERRRFYGPENIRLRCSTCHKAKSKREAAERAALRKKGPVDLDAAS